MPGCGGVGQTRRYTAFYYFVFRIERSIHPGRAQSQGFRCLMITLVEAICCCAVRHRHPPSFSSSGHTTGQVPVFIFFFFFLGCVTAERDGGNRRRLTIKQRSCRPVAVSEWPLTRLSMHPSTSYANQDPHCADFDEEGRRLLHAHCNCTLHCDRSCRTTYNSRPPSSFFSRYYTTPQDTESNKSWHTSPSFSMQSGAATFRTQPTHHRIITTPRNHRPHLHVSSPTFHPISPFRPDKPFCDDQRQRLFLQSLLFLASNSCRPT